MLALATARPVCAAADQNQTPPPPPPPTQGQTGQGDPSQTGRGQSGQGQEPGLWLGRPRSNRPYRGLFGGGVGETEQLLTLHFNVGGGYDSSVYVNNSDTRLTGSDNQPVGNDNQPIGEDTQPAVNGTQPNPVTPFQVARSSSGFGAGSVNLNYTLNRSSYSFWSAGGVGFSYYPVLLDAFDHRYQANVGGDWRISRKTSVNGDYAMFFGPVQHLVTPIGSDPMLGPTDPFANGLGGGAETYRNENGHVDVNYLLTRRVTLSAGTRLWRVVTPDHLRDQSTREITARMSVGLTRDLQFYTAYRFSSQRFGHEINVSPFNTHNIDAGLGFSKALSLTRHTYLSFASGTAAVSDGVSTRYWITGNVTVRRDLGRTWGASLDYSRAAQFVESFLQPVFSDTVSGYLSGLFTRRVQFDAGAYLTYGKVGIDGPSNGYRSFYTTSGVGVGITRFLSGNVRYLYARYSFDQGVLVPRDLQFTDRQGVTAYLSAWMPLYSRARRP